MDINTPSTVNQTGAGAQAALAATQTEDTGGAAALSSDFETFLKMLTVQMENQDPLNPVESSDFAVQLATFSGVEQQVRSNDLLESLVGQQSVSALSQLAGWVGMEARAAVAGPFDGTPMTLYPKVPNGADQATLIVRNESGGEVARTAISISSDPFQWQGIDQNGAPLPPGNYSFTVQASADDKVIDTSPVEIYAPITEARITDGSPVVVFASGEELAAAKVTAVRSPGS